MPAVSLKSVTASFGGAPVLDSVNLVVEAGERTCITGRNGEGKSTLLKIIGGVIEPDSGEVALSPGLRTAYLSQDVPADEPGSVADVVARRGANGRDNGPAPTAASFITQLGLDAAAPFNSLSGGLRRRALLAAAIASGPDLLLLDEPTNHLDVQTIEWLEAFLARATLTCLFVTHDRAFLKRTAKRVLDLDRGKIAGWDCDYATFLTRKAELIADEEAYWERKGKKLAAEEAWIRRGVKARTTRNEGRVAALEKLRAEFAERRTRQGAGRMAIGGAEASGRKVVEFDNVTFAYPGSPPVLKDFSASIERGERIGILGANGTGKTTLLRLVTGALEPQAGTIELGARVRVTTFDQLACTLKPDVSVLENLTEGGDELMVNGKRRHAYGYLGDFLFTPDRARSPVKSLSGGERARLLLAKLFADPGNLLVMDEPTNDLDVETLELLEELLLEYEGTLILVSHDREFIDNVVTSSFVLEGDGTVGLSPGGYADWERQRAHARKAAAEDAPAAPAPEQKPAPKKQQSARLGYMEQRELSFLPEKISVIEKEVAQISELLSTGTIFVEDPDAAKAATDRLPAAEAELETLIARWMELETRAGS